ncbi:MAG: sodium:proton antiporter [Casimicrobiaceae bacterium]
MIPDSSLSALDITSIFLVVTALLAYLNQRFIKLPSSIGVMIIALILSLALIGLDALGIFESASDMVKSLLDSLDFSELVIQGMLSILLFAAALQVDLSELHAYRWPVAAMAIVGTLTSTFVVGIALWWVSPLVGLKLSFLYCMLFGALISPTDPIAVMGILTSAKAPKNLELVITGESLFNDGVAVVAFVLLFGVLVSGKLPTVPEIGFALLREAGGGLVFGLVLGFIVVRLLQSIDEYQVEVLITLAAVLGGYALAARLHVSGPLAMVVAGLVVGNHGRELAMSDVTRHHVDLFWQLLDHILNAVLFALLGMEVLVIRFPPGIALAATAAILVTLLARGLTVGMPAAIWRKAFGLPAGSWKVLTWGALRGGISVALVLSLPSGRERETLLALTYCVVVFSILVQGMSIGAVVKRSLRGS